MKPVKYESKEILMKVSGMKASRLRASGILFILSGLVWFLAAALGKQYTLVVVGVAFLGIGTIFIAKSKKSVAS
jgi:hypothetical protein